MTSFSAAAAAALELDNTSLANGVYAYHTVIRLDVAHNPHCALDRFAPHGENAAR
jgi:hypothetical protein